MIKLASPNSQRHFLASFTAYLESVVAEAANRENNIIPTIDDYVANRRENVATRPGSMPFELDMDLPDEVFFHPVVVKLSTHIADLVLVDNVGATSARGIKIDG